MYVWILQDLDTEAEFAFNAQHMAMRHAEGIVGNRAVSGPIGSDMAMLYGPGDGATRVMIRRFPRDLALRMFPDLTLPVSDGRE